MATAQDVAAYIVGKTGSIDAMKLQKLIYYSMVWSLVWRRGAKLFEDPIEAWAYGPVVRSVFSCHRKQFVVSSWPWGDAGQLTSDERDVVDRVVDFYGKYTGQQLSDFTHREKPWVDARRGLAPGERGKSVIDPASMQTYYSSLK